MKIKYSIIVLVMLSIFIVPVQAQSQPERTYAGKIGDESEYRITDYNHNGKTSETYNITWNDGTWSEVTFQVGTILSFEICNLPQLNTTQHVSLETVMDNKTGECGVQFRDYFSSVYTNKSEYQLKLTENSTKFQDTTYSLDGNIYTSTMKSTQLINGVPFEIEIKSRDINTGWLTRYYYKQIDSTGKTINLWGMNLVTGSTFTPGFGLESLIMFFLFVTPAVIRKKRS